MVSDLSAANFLFLQCKKDHPLHQYVAVNFVVIKAIMLLLGQFQTLDYLLLLETCQKFVRRPTKMCQIHHRCVNLLRNGTGSK